MSDWPRLGYVVRGMKKKTAGARGKQRLPITPHILGKLKSVWEKCIDPLNGHMLWAASCMCFFGFLRSGEVVVPSAKTFDPAIHLTDGDVKVDNREKPSYLEVKIKASKTDIFRKGVTVYLGTTGTDICPVAAVLNYMVKRKPSSESVPFFVFSDGSPLTREKLVRELRAALSRAGIKAEDYAGHSFRIGAASTAAACGMPDSLIKTLGRWESAAYTLYIRTPRSTLCAVAKTLASTPRQ